jgi:uncharacterized membrane protein
MTRQAFMARLREGLRDLPPQAQADIIADYETHFADGLAAAKRTSSRVSATRVVWPANCVPRPG